MRRDPASAEAARRVREGARAQGDVSTYARAFGERGRRLAEQGANQEAIASLIEAALVYEEELNELAEAAELYRSVLKLDPGHRRALFALGVLLHDLKRWDDLVALYRQRLEKTTDEGERTTLHLYVAEILSEHLGEVRAAFEEVSTAARLAPQNIRIITRLERLGEQAQRLEEVAVVIGDLIMHQQDPRVRAALSLRLAELHVGPLGDPQRALAFFRAALADDGGNPELLSEVEDVFRERARFDELAALLEDAAGDRRIGPQRARLERELARIYELELGDKKRALVTLTRAAKHPPHDRDLLDEVMRLGLSIGALDVVAATFDEVAAETTNGLLRTYLLLKLGHLYGGALSRPADAIRAYEAVLREDPHHKEARRRLGNLCERVGDFVRLAALAEEEIQLAATPADQLEPLRRLARVRQQRLDDTAGARQVYHRILELAPGDAEAGEELTRLTTLADELRLQEESAGLAKPGRSRVEAAPDPENWTEVEGQPFGPEAETEVEIKRALELPPFPGPAATPLARAPSALEAEIIDSRPLPVEPSIIETIPSLADDESADEYTVQITQSQIAKSEPIAELVEAAEVSLPDPEPEPELDEDDELEEPVAIARPPEPPPFVLMPEAPEPPELDAQSRARLGEELLRLQQALQEAAREKDHVREARLSQEIVDAAVALGDHERAFFGQLGLCRLEPDRPHLERLVELGRAARSFEATVASVEELLPRLELDTQIHLGLALAALEAEDMGQVAASNARLAALAARVPGDLAVVEQWGRVLEQLGDHARLAQLYEAAARDASDEREAGALRRRAAEVRAVHLGDPSGAADALLSQLERTPEDYNCYDAAARHLAQAGRWADLVTLHEGQLYRVEGPARAALRVQIARTALEQQGDAATAERMLRQAISDDPRNAEILERLIDLYQSLEQWESIAEVLSEQLPLVRSAPGRAALRRRLAQLAEGRLGSIELARRHLAEAVREDPGDLPAITDLERLARQAEDWPAVVDALLAAARALVDPMERATRLLEAARVRRAELVDIPGAIELYRDTLAVVPDHPVALRELAELAEVEGDFSTAIDVLRRLATMVPGEARAQALVRLGHLLARELDRPEEAAAEYARALEAHPSSIEALAELSRFHEGRGDHHRALDFTEREADLTVDERRRATLWIRAAELARVRLGDPVRALASYRRALEADPDDLSAEAALGELLLAQGDATRAYTHLSRAARGLRRTDLSRAAELYLAAGRAAERLELSDDAIAAYDAALELAPLAKEPLSRLAAVLAAREVWERAHELSAMLLLHHEATLSAEERAQVYLRMARARLAGGDREGAIRLAERARSIDAESVEALELLSEELAAEGRAEEAAEALRQLGEVTRDPDDRRAVQLRAARAFAEQAGDLGRAIALLGQLHSLSPHDIEVAELLAQYRERVGEPRGAAAVLAAAARALEGRPRADLLVKAGRIVAGSSRDRDEARQVLLEAMAISATHREGLRELSAMLELARDFATLAKLQERAGQEFLQDPFTAQDAADGNRVQSAFAAFEAAKQLYRFRLERPQDALRMARAQVQIDPERPGLQEDLARIIDESEALLREPRLAKESLDRWAALVEIEPGLIDGLRRLHARASEHGDLWRARAIAEVMELLGVATAREQTLFLERYQEIALPRLRRPPALDVPAFPEEHSPLESLFSLLALAPLAALEEVLPEPKLKRRDRAQISSLGPDISAAISESCALLGVETPPLFVRDDAPRPMVPAFAERKPALVISLAVAAQLPPPVLRFYAGRALGLLRPRALALALLPLDALRDALEGLVREQVRPELLFADPRAAKRRGRALEREIPAATRPAVIEKVTHWLGGKDRTTLFDEREAVLRTAERWGLVTCGSLRIATGILEDGGPRARSWFLPLLRFAASRQYAALGAQLEAR
ncbi:MAG: tetratricopeptide repeat protein [Deltaproteobacteria bacterium]|nr:tetratricopeptide repeat protein [Deltaproteobacteria bacterium]